MSHQLLIVGSVAIDTIHTPQGHAHHQLGGSATFAALAARHWTNPLILSAIGGDYPHDLYQKLETAGLDLRHLTVDKNAKSFRWAGAYDEGLGTRQTVGIELGVMATHTLHMPQMPAVRAVMMATYNPARQLEMIAKLPQGAFLACDTIQVYIQHQHQDLMQLMRACQLVCIDHVELLEMMQVGSEAAAVKKLLSWGPRWAIIKYGANGSRLYGAKGENVHVGIYKTHAKDTTGAGDTYLGTVMAHVAHTGQSDLDTLVRGMKMGAAAASVTVEAFGVDALITADLKEIERRAQRLVEAVGV